MEYKKRLKAIKKRLIEEEKKLRILPTIEENHEEVCHEFYNYDMDACLCTDNKNRFKELYPSEHEAEKTAKFLFDEQGIFLMVYPCPYSMGWHLSRG